MVSDLSPLNLFTWNAEEVLPQQTTHAPFLHDKTS